MVGRVSRWCLAPSAAVSTAGTHEISNGSRGAGNSLKKLERLPLPPRPKNDPREELYLSYLSLSPPPKMEPEMERVDLRRPRELERERDRESERFFLCLPDDFRWEEREATEPFHGSKKPMVVDVLWCLELQ